MYCSDCRFWQKETEEEGECLRLIIVKGVYKNVAGEDEKFYCRKDFGCIFFGTKGPFLVENNDVIFRYDPMHILSKFTPREYEGNKELVQWLNSVFWVVVDND